MTDFISPDNGLDQGAASALTKNRRRRFVRGAGAGVTALAIFAPRSSLAVSCLSPSATASINLLHSRTNRQGGDCYGLSPGFWKNAPTTHPSDWNACGAVVMVRFGDTFANPSNLANLSFLQVLQNGNGAPTPDKDELGAHLVAAWCNWKTGKVPASVLDEAKLITMSLKAVSGYEPTPGAPLWYGLEIVNFIKSTFSG